MYVYCAQRKPATNLDNLSPLLSVLHASSSLSRLGSADAESFMPRGCSDFTTYIDLEDKSASPVQAKY